MKKSYGVLISCFVIIFLVCGSVRVSAQTITSDRAKAAPGTFQIINDGKVSEAISTDYYESLLYEIEQKRSDDQIVYIDLSVHTRVMILPRKTINAPEFVPLPEMAGSNNSN